MTNTHALEELYNGLIGHCKSSYLKDQPNNELEKTCEVYKEFYEQVKDGLEKLEQYKKLEEQIGCPFEVLFRALKDGIYSKDFREDLTERAILIFWGEYGWILHTSNCDELTKNYKKTWWLKADKSE